MSEERKQKPLGIPPFYWANPPKQVKRPSGGFANKKQKQFYTAVQVFKVAKFAAAVAVALIIVGMI